MTNNKVKISLFAKMYHKSMNPTHDNNLREIERLIRYTFKDKSLGIKAITTRAYSQDHPQCPHNQDLEFLGDAVLSLVIAEWLYEIWGRLKEYPVLTDKTPEGVMTRLRQEMVNNRYLAQCASKHRLCDFVYDSQENIMAVKNGLTRGPGDDLIEALIAAIYLDNDRSITIVKRFILDFLDLSDLLNDEQRLIEAVTRKNPKDALLHKFQELMKYTPDIAYPIKEHRVDGSLHHFVLGIMINGKLLPGITGSGSNKAAAEYEASKQASQFLEDIDWDLSRIE